MSTTLHEPTDVAEAPLELLRGMLEEAFSVHTARLTELTVLSRLPRHGGHDAHVLETLIDSHRRRVADTAQALRRMADGTYGICTSCSRPIPLGRLRTVPHATQCARCESLWPR